jgi:membrane-anchored glycerophosphoryl diester phosphodiesterase (GDPDase)
MCQEFSEHIIISNGKNKKIAKLLENKRNAKSTDRKSWQITKQQIVLDLYWSYFSIALLMALFPLSLWTEEIKVPFKN